MYLPSVMDMVTGLEPEEALTYAPSFGIMPLRQAWQESMVEKRAAGEIGDTVLYLEHESVFTIGRPRDRSSTRTLVPADTWR